MPLGSSSEAPVIKPGPKIQSSLAPLPRTGLLVESAAGCDDRLGFLKKMGRYEKSIRPA